MKKRTAELILKDPEKFAHHDRVFLNNPVVMQGMGLAPLVVVATTGQNGLMLAAAVTLLLVPSRVLACLLSRLVPLRDEEPTPEQLQKKLLPRALLYAASAAVVYLAAYPILNFVFGTGLLNLGIYLPMLVVEPLLTYRFGRVQETVHKAVSKGVRITVGYALLLLVVGIVREWLSLGTVFGAPVGRWALLPLAKMPAGGFIVLGILCAIWRAAAAKRKEYLKKTRAMAVDMETATLFSCGFANHIPTGALLLVSDQPMTPDGVKTDKSDNLVTRNYVEEHVEIGIASLRMIIDEKKTVKHLKFDW